MENIAYKLEMCITKIGDSYDSICALPIKTVAFIKNKGDAIQTLRNIKNSLNVYEEASILLDENNLELDVEYDGVCYSYQFTFRRDVIEYVVSNKSFNKSELDLRYEEQG